MLFGILIVQSGECFNFFRGLDMVLCHKSDHFTAGHFTDRAFFDDFSVVPFAEYTGDEAYRIWKILRDTYAVFFGSKVDDAVCIRK